EPADLGHGGAAVQRGSGARREDLAGRVVASVVAGEAASLLACTVTAQQVAGVVQAAGVGHVHHLARHRGDPRVGGQRGGCPGQPVGREGDVGVDEGDRVHVRVQGGESPVGGGGEAP